MPHRVHPAMVAPRVSELVSLYQKSEGIVDKAKHSDELAGTPDDSRAAILIQTHTRDFRDRRLTLEEKAGLYRLIFNLGRMAKRSDVAAMFLERASRPVFWDQKRSWKNDDDRFENDQNPVLAGQCLMALGLSGRAVAMDIANDYAMNLPEGTIPMAGAIVTAVSKFDRATFGVGPREDSENTFSNWAKGAGRKWVEWADCVVRVR